MTYTVVWRRTAETALAEIWLTSRNRDGVLRAADELDQLLTHRPLDIGESRGGSLRVAVLPPLVLHFNVSEDDRIVHVLTVHLVRRSGSNGEG